jgi:hypothetical protein
MPIAYENAETGRFMRRYPMKKILLVVMGLFFLSGF